MALWIGERSAKTFTSIRLKLEALTYVDLTVMSFKVGIFDKDRHLSWAYPVRFRMDFPLVRGESVTASFGLGEDRPDDYRIVIRRSSATAEPGVDPVVPKKKTKKGQ